MVVKAQELVPGVVRGNSSEAKLEFVDWSGRVRLGGVGGGGGESGRMIGDQSED